MAVENGLETIHPLADIDILLGKPIYIGPTRILFFVLNGLNVLIIQSIQTNSKRG